MKIKIENSNSKELKEYLLTQENIEKIDIIEKDWIDEIIIKHKENITPFTIMKYIDLFFDNKDIMTEFDKEEKYPIKTLKYNIEDICCEMCYKDLIKKLFNNKLINSVKSNYDYEKPFFNIELSIEYDVSLKEKDIIKCIKENIN